MLTDNGVSVTCTSTPTTRASKATGRIPSGTHTGTSPVKVGTTKTLVFHHCSGPLGAVTVKVHNLPYKVKVDSVTRRGRTDGMITGVSTHVTMTGCSFDVTGRAPGWYSNARHRLHVTPKLPIKPLNRARLTVKNVNGCAGVVSNGDHPTYKATYKLNRAITIHSKKV